ncbi:MAG: hypothetical protein AAGI24_00165 [Pseudomonadota bacterium]
MADVAPVDTLDIAILPLGDGRHMMLPLEALAEVQQVNFAGRSTDDLGEFSWRGYELPVESLDEVCGLELPPVERLTTVAVFKSDKHREPPFRAMAFSGTASPGSIEPSWLSEVELSTEGVFSSATRLHNELYLIPDLEKLLFNEA